MEGAHGGRDISWSSRVLDLRQSETALHAGVRKSYRHLINRGRRRWIIEEIQGPQGEAFHALWTLANGRRRALAAEALMTDWLKQGHALLFGAREGDEWQAFLYAILYKQGAYFASAPSLTRGAMHALQWTAILALKARGVTQYELGWQARPGDTEKDRAISFFKTGFGGEDRIVQAVERDIS